MTVEIGPSYLPSYQLVIINRSKKQLSFTHNEVRNHPIESETKISKVEMPKREWRNAYLGHNLTNWIWKAHLFYLTEHKEWTSCCHHSTWDPKELESNLEEEEDADVIIKLRLMHKNNIGSLCKDTNNVIIGQVFSGMLRLVILSWMTFY